MSVSYSEKLKDPRWQKKRLQILERDRWTCVRCGHDEKTLHVHHLRYSRCAPWDAPDEDLAALCHHCHERVEELKAIFNRLVLDPTAGYAIGNILGDLSDPNKKDTYAAIFTVASIDPQFFDTIKAVYELSQTHYQEGFHNGQLTKTNTPE